MSLVKWEKIASEIETAKDWDEILSLNDQVAAFQAWAKQTKQSLETQNKIAEYRLRLERKKGNWLNIHVPHGGDRNSSMSDQNLKLKDINVSDYESFTSRQIASIPEETFEKEIERRKQNVESAVSELTIAGMLRLSKMSVHSYDDDDKAFPIKLGKKKRWLQQEVHDSGEKSVHSLVNKVIDDFIKKKERGIFIWFDEIAQAS